jgi:hypothetical protein
MPLTGASAKRTVLRIREAKTRSPKFSSRISIASFAWIVRVLQLDQPTHREILTLDGDDHLVCRCQGVDRQQPEARRRIDADEVVVVGDHPQSPLERALAADRRGQGDLGPGEVDRSAGDVDLPLADDLTDRDLVDEDVVHRRLQRVRIDPLGHREVALWIHVDAEHTVPLLDERRGQVERRRRLGDAALLVGEGDDLGRTHASLQTVGIARTALYSHALRRFLQSPPQAVASAPCRPAHQDARCSSGG